MTEQKTERETKEYLEEIQKTVQRSKELLEVAKGKIEETRKKCEELGIDPENLKDVDVDAVTFTYNADQGKITFNKRLWLSDSLIYHMILDGTFDVLELTDKKFVLQQTSLLGVTTTYAYHRYK